MPGNKILVIDDEENLRKLFSSLLSKKPDPGYEVATAKNGQEGLELAKLKKPDLIITDIKMPGMDGMEVCRRLKSDPELEDIPIIMVTGTNDNDLKVTGLVAGASDFVTKPFSTPELLVRIRNLVHLKELTDHLKGETHRLEEKVREKTFEIGMAMKRLESANFMIREAYLEAIIRLTMAAEYKDDDTGMHIRRMGHYAAVIAELMGLSPDEARNLFYAAPMHDIGKIGIPDHILLKPAALTIEEFEIVKQHTVIGGKILSSSKSEVLRAGEIVALTHHERWDGTGYPAGLKGEAIPLPGRIIFICDVYDALRSRRPYKSALSHKEACDKIIKGDDRMCPSFIDPAVLSLFERYHERFREIFETPHK